MEDTNASDTLPASSSQSLKNRESVALANRESPTRVHQASAEILAGLSAAPKLQPGSHGLTTANEARNASPHAAYAVPMPYSSGLPVGSGVHLGKSQLLQSDTSTQYRLRSSSDSQASSLSAGEYAAQMTKTHLGPNDVDTAYGESKSTTSRKRPRTDRDRKMHALYSRKNYYKGKQHFEDLRRSSYELRAEKEQLAKENTHLSKLVNMALAVAQEHESLQAPLPNAQQHSIPWVLPLLNMVQVPQSSTLKSNSASSNSSSLAGNAPRIDNNARRAAPVVPVAINPPSFPSKSPVDVRATKKRQVESRGEHNQRLPKRPGIVNQKPLVQHEGVDSFFQVIRLLATGQIPSVRHLQQQQRQQSRTLDFDPIVLSIRKTESVPAEVVGTLLESLLVSIIGRAELENLVPSRQNGSMPGTGTATHAAPTSDLLLRPSCTPEQLYQYLYCLDHALQGFKPRTSGKV